FFYFKKNDKFFLNPFIFNSKDGKLRYIRNFNADYRVAPNNKLIYCMNTKSMSTVMEEIMCLFYNPKLYLKKNISLTEKMYDYMTCSSPPAVLNNRKKLRNFINYPNNKKYHYYFIVRDPIDRFLSGFLDKCVRERINSKNKVSQCHGCGYDIECFINEIYRRAKIFHDTGFLFPKTMEDYHFMPQSWKCHMNEEKEKYTIFYYTNKTKLYSDLDAYYKKIGISKYLRDKIQHDLRNNYTEHKTFDSPLRGMFENYLKGDKDLMKKLVNLYYTDYIMFNFSFPKID
uniref:Sulfotransferase domain-containing protein n=1 Tax=Strongyloides stercoralis TaxID=6248 RepID=A0AAF5DCP0_STRER